MPFPAPALDPLRWRVSCDSAILCGHISICEQRARGRPESREKRPRDRERRTARESERPRTRRDETREQRRAHCFFAPPPLPARTHPERSTQWATPWEDSRGRLGMPGRVGVVCVIEHAREFGWSVRRRTRAARLIRHRSLASRSWISKVQRTLGIVRLRRYRPGRNIRFAVVYFGIGNAAETH